MPCSTTTFSLLSRSKKRLKQCSRNSTRLRQNRKSEIMTIKQAYRLGYRVIQASAVEIGLSRNGQGIRTWFISDFHATGKLQSLPSLAHPKIQKAIRITGKFKLCAA